jgi:hypothetical protein
MRYERGGISEGPRGEDPIEWPAATREDRVKLHRLLFPTDRVPL